MSTGYNKVFISTNGFSSYFSLFYILLIDRKIERKLKNLLVVKLKLFSNITWEFKNLIFKFFIGSYLFESNG